MQLNDVGDLVVSEPDALRAIADPHRLDLIDRLRRGDPVQDADRPHLEELQRFGFVEKSGDSWLAVGRGIYFEIPIEPAAQSAARDLAKVMLLREADRPRRWVEADEPKLTVDWARAAGMFNARVRLTADELRAAQEQLERVLAPYTSREEPPADAAPVRILAYFLPEPTSGV